MTKETVKIEFSGFGGNLTINGECRCACKCGCLSNEPILAGLCNDCCNGGHLIDKRYTSKEIQNR